MKKQLRSKAIILIIASMWSHHGHAKDRIESLLFNKAQVQTIAMAPGLGSVVIFPCPLADVFVGRAEDVTAKINPNDKRILFLNLKSSTSESTNLIARCEQQRKPFVFDVIPSRGRHQDVLEIASAYGGAGFHRAELIEDSKTLSIKSSHRIEIKKPILIESGNLGDQ